MIFSADGNWTLPTGMVWVKHFDLPLDRANPAGPRRRLETRFLVKTADGTYGLTYKWRDDGTEADLVGEDGEDAFYQVQSNGQTVTQRWHYPARYECLECHTAGRRSCVELQHAANEPEPSLRRADAKPDQGAERCRVFYRARHRREQFACAGKPNDTTQSLEWRVRSYFMANCMQCHQPGGPSFAMWDARVTTRTDNAHIINGVLKYVSDDEANRFVVPGDLSRSMAYKRLLGVEPRMPPLGTYRARSRRDSAAPGVDHAGVAGKAFVCAVAGPVLRLNGQSERHRNG
jgi:mono/diheme cytochrome c family protein